MLGTTRSFANFAQNPPIYAGYQRLAVLDRIDKMRLGGVLSPIRVPRRTGRSSFWSVRARTPLLGHMSGLRGCGHESANAVPSSLCPARDSGWMRMHGISDGASV